MQNKITAVIGTKGSGKSTYCKKLFARCDRAICVDAMGEYSSAFVVTDPVSTINYLKNQKRFRIAFVPIDEGDIDLVCRAARGKGKCTIFIEEIHHYCTPHSIDPDLGKLFKLARHSEVDIVYTAQRFSDISRLVTSQTDEFALFRLSEPVDLVSLDKRFEGVSERVSRLRNFEHITIDVREWRGQLEVEKCIS